MCIRDSTDALDLVIGVIKERVDLIPGVRTLGRPAVVLLNVGSGVPVEEDLGRMCTEVLLADPVPAVVGIADIAGERAERGMVATELSLIHISEPTRPY